MWKKLVVCSLVVVGALYLLNRTNAGSKVFSLGGLMWSKAASCLDRQVPPEVEIERIRHELAKRGGEMKKQLSTIAEETVALDNLKQDIDVTRANLKKQSDNIMTMKKDLESGQRFVTYDGKEYPASRVRDKLVRDWASYKRCEEGLKSKEKLFDAKQASLNNAREQMAEMRGQYEQVEVELAQLETDVKEVRLAQTRSNFQLDDSHLAKIKEAKSKLQDQVKAMKTQLDLEAQFANDLDIRVEKKIQTADVLKEIDEHFAKSESKLTAERP